MPLTDVQVRNTKPAEKAFKLFHGEGLYLLVQPNGGKYWRLKYRYRGKEKLLAIGVYPKVGLKSAVESARNHRKTLDQGADPSAEKKRQRRERDIRAANTFEAVAREWHSKREKKWVAGHAARVLTSLEQNVFPEVGARPIAELTAAEILSSVRVVEKRGALEIAARVLQRIGSVFRYAIVTGRAKANPVTDLRGALETPQQRHYAALGEAELPEFMQKLSAYDGHALTRIGLQLVLLTFVRTGELRAAEWSEFDFDEAEWRIPAERMKMKRVHIVPLSTQAIALLRQAQALSGERAYVFPNQANPAKPMSENTMLYAVYRMGYHQRTTVHGFRATASTILNEMGYRPDVIERQLAHAERNDVRAAYNHAEYLPERRQMMQQWADVLDAIAKGKKVVPLRRSKTAA